MRKGEEAKELMKRERESRMLRKTILEMVGHVIWRPSLNLVQAHVLLYSTNHPFRLSISDWDRCINLSGRNFNEDDGRRRWGEQENDGY